jgi:hypothetical protein
MMPETGGRRIVRVAMVVIPKRLCASMLAAGGVLLFLPDATASVEPVEAQEIFEGLRGDDCGNYLSRAILFTGTPEFTEREADENRLVLYWQIAVCAADQNLFETAFTYADKATAIRRDIAWPQVVRLHFGMYVDRPDASLEALEVLSNIAPEQVRKIDTLQLNRLLRAANDADATGDRSLAVYEALVRSDYRLQSPYDEDGLRIGHARLLLERGRTAEARKLVDGIVDVGSVVEMRVSRLFDPLRGDPSFEAQLDVAAAMERDLARSRAAMESNPAMMEAVYLHAMRLVKALRNAEGLEITDAALARYEQDRQSFQDGAEYRVWLVNMRGYFLYGLGRAEEGRAALREAAALDDRGEPNVSNIINFGIYLINEARAAEALALIPKIGEPSPYGKGWIEMIRACAGVQTGDDAVRLQGLEHLKAHESDNPAALSRALLCDGDIDAAAALMIRRLEDRKQRVDALLALQIGPATADESLPYAAVTRGRFAKLREREDVRAAVEKVGRIETVPVDLEAGE